MGVLAVIVVVECHDAVPCVRRYCVGDSCLYVGNCGIVARINSVSIGGAISIGGESRSEGQDRSVFFQGNDGVFIAKCLRYLCRNRQSMEDRDSGGTTSIFSPMTRFPAEMNEVFDNGWDWRWGKGGRSNGRT